MQDPRLADLEVVTARLIDAIAREEAVTAVVPAFLLRQYLGANRDDLRDALGGALARALECAYREPSVIGRAAWLTLFVEATAVADDERIRVEADRLLAGLQAEWPAQDRVADASASVEACLRAAALDDPGALIQRAIDHLEHVIGGSYRPGDGLMRDVNGIRVRCTAGDHAHAASALLTAFELTGRLPYSMLAEELMLIVRRELPAGVDAATHCDAARVLCRLASLHTDPEYRAAAVIAADADYRADASLMLAAQSGCASGGTTAEAAAYGLALLDLLK